MKVTNDGPQSELWSFDRQAAFNWNSTAARIKRQYVLLVRASAEHVTMAIDRQALARIWPAPLAMIGETGLLTVGRYRTP
jgi:hypothetical protein